MVEEPQELLVAQNLSKKCDGCPGKHPLWRKSVASSARQGLIVECNEWDEIVGNGIYFRCEQCDYDVCRICIGVSSKDKRKKISFFLS